jgi:IS30 family transposase
MNNEKTSNRKKYLNFEDRKLIEKMIKEWLSLRKIWVVLWRWKSTIWDEIKNNSTFYDWYKAELAHKKFLRNQLLKRNKDKIETNIKLQEYIIFKLKDDWSPEEISWRLKLFNNDKDLDNYIWYVCFETIYKFIYSKNWLKLLLPKLLRRHKAKRTKWYSRKSKSSEIIKDKVSIHDRPEVINKRKRIGDFESDSVIFPNQKQVLNVNVDRRTRILRFDLVKDKTAMSSIAVQKRIIYEFEEYWLDVFSFTYDNWTENVYHTELHQFWVKTYFCDTYSSWQKWTVENMNMFIRQYLPRNIDLSKLTVQDLHNIQEKLNNRPRKCLNYLSPNEFFYKETWIKLY